MSEVRSLLSWTRKLSARTGALFGFDDVPLVSLASLPSSLACAILLSVVNFSTTTCAFDRDTNVYVWGLWSSWTLTTTSSIVTTIIGTQGGPFERSKRLPALVWLLNIDIVLRIVELIFNCYGVWIVYLRDEPVCASSDEAIPDTAVDVHAKMLLTVCLWLTWFTLLCFVVTFLLFWLSVRVATSEGGMNKWRSSILWWLKRMLCLGCINEGDLKAFEQGNRLDQITELMYSHFKPASMGPTDILSAVLSAMLLQRSTAHAFSGGPGRVTQAAVRRAVQAPKKADAASRGDSSAADPSGGASDLQRSASSPSSSSDSSRGSEDSASRGVEASMAELCDAEVSLRYACAVYASTCDVQLLQAICKDEAAEARCTPCMQDKLSKAWVRQQRGRGGEALSEHLRKRHGVTDDKARLDYEILRAVSCREDEDIAWFVTDLKAAGMLPYAVFADPEERKIVVAIRGSAEMKDVITDVLMHPCAATDWLPPPLLEEVAEEEHYVHSGMKNSTDAILKDLQDTGILHAMLLDISNDDRRIADLTQTWPEAEEAASSPHARRRGSAAGRGSSSGRRAPSGSHAGRSDRSAGDNDAGVVGSDRSADIQVDTVIVDMPAEGSGGRGGAKSGEAGSRSCDKQGDKQGGACAACNKSTCNDDMQDCGSKGLEAEVSAHEGDTAEAAEGEHLASGDEGESATAAERRDIAEPVSFLPLKYRGLAKQGWSLEITGQSLGAGVAALLAMRLQYFLRDIVRVHCWAFSAPGCLSSPSIAAALGVPVSESCITRGCAREFTAADRAPTVQALCMGEDVIPRSTSTTLVRLRDQMVEAAARCRVWKWRVILGCLRGAGRRAMQGNARLFYKMDELPEECRTRLEEYSREAEVQAGNAGDVMVVMHPPGPLLLLERQGNVWDADYEKHAVVPKWVGGPSVIHEGIILSLTMVTDHVPYYLWMELRRVVGKPTAPE